MSVIMKKLMSFIPDSTLVEQALKLRHSSVHHCIGDMEMEDLEARFEDKDALMKCNCSFL